MERYNGTIPAGTQSTDITAVPNTKIAVLCDQPVQLLVQQEADPTKWSVFATLKGANDAAVLDCPGDTLRIRALDADAKVSINDSTGTAGSPGGPVQSVQGVTGGTALVVQESDGLTRTDSITSAATLYQQDCTGYRSVFIQCTSAAGGGTWTGEVSNDGANWTSVAYYSPQNLGNAAPSAATITVATTNYYQFPTPARYFRLRETAHTTGGVANSYVSCFRSEPIPKIGVSVGSGPTGTSAFQMQGTASTGSAVVGNPVRTGVNSVNSATVRSSGQISDILATLYGVPCNKPYSIPELDWSYAPPSGGLANSATAVTLRTAGGAGIRNYLTSLCISSDPLGAACDLVLLDGSTVIYRHRLQTTGLPGGLNLDFPTPLKTTAATALNLQTQVSGTATAVTGGIYVNAQGYAAP